MSSRNMCLERISAMFAEAHPVMETSNKMVGKNNFDEKNILH